MFAVTRQATWALTFGLRLTIACLLSGCGGPDAIGADPEPALEKRPAHAAFLSDAPPSASPVQQTALVETPLDLPPWFEAARREPVGSMFQVSPQDDSEYNTLRALGFVPHSPEIFRKKVDLLERTRLTYFHSAALPNIDAIAIISINRKHLADQYLYQTLRFLFAELPEDAHVNVLVGNADHSYVSRERLGEVVGPSAEARIHVVEAPTEVTDLFTEEGYGVAARATWNYARALRSYEGSNSLLVLEDDVSMATGAISQLTPWAKALPAHVISLFNPYCHTQSLWALKSSSLRVQLVPIRHSWDFPTTQGILFSREVANGAGNFLAERMNRETYDYMLGRFIAKSAGGMGFFYPSVLQHIGIKSSGLSAIGLLPQSTCYQPVLAPPSTN